MIDTVLKTKDLTKKYADFCLNDIDLDIPKGSIVGLVGQNGAGKTTLIKLILGIDKNDKGEVEVLGSGNIDNVKQDIGVVLDNSFFPEILRIKEIRSVMKPIYKNWDDELFSKYIKQFGINENSKIKHLSKGMKKKLEISAALAHKPKFLILDEPTSGLDPIVRREILDMFMNFVEDENNSILISSHITDDIETIADYIVFIDKGEMIFTKSIEELRDDYAVIRCKDTEFCKIDKTDIVRLMKNKYSYDVLVDNKEEAKHKYGEFVIDRTTIDDIILFFVKGEIVE